MGIVSQQNIQALGRSSARKRPRHCLWTGWLTKRSIWNLTRNCHMGGYATSQSSNWRCSRPTSDPSWQTASFSNHHQWPQCQSCVPRSKTEDYSCVSSFEISTLAQYRIDTPSPWFHGYSIQCTELRLSTYWTFRMLPPSYKSKKVTSSRLHS